ncbi:helix-turn-helix domain-containing protein [Tenacibaculum aiptasiae]|uniref:helix-turn-helix domain-containing protein n=1 Tax=Tenacibaculum aiptasiae TaxID=426481 RepID=UPI003B5AB5E2
MSVEKDKLFNLIKEKLPNNVLFTEEIADVLDISYDAAYRRINGKTSLSFKEALELARYYKISLNKLYNISSTLSKSIIKNDYVNTYEGVNDFYKDIAFYVATYASDKNSKVYYTAKNIPIYHIPVNTLYSKFRVYVYLNFLSKKEESKIEPFSKFIEKQFFTNESKRFREKFKEVSITDVWSDTTINSCLHTIYYFYKTKLITRTEALQLCDEILLLIERIEDKAKNKTWNSKKGLKYELYYNKLVNINHVLFLKSETKKGLLVPYTSLSYMRIEDKIICNEVDEYFQKQLQFSQNISGSAEVERRMFFTLMYEKIEQLKHQINSKAIMSFI